jgi:hypothetical protein
MIPGLEPSNFVIGNIAPDSGIPDEKWEKFDPPGELLHFEYKNSLQWGVADLDFFLSHLKNKPHKTEDPEQFSFLLGYFFHLITDNLWDYKINKPTEEKYSAEFQQDPQFVWEVKRDWYGLDFIYLCDNPESISHRIFIACEHKANYLDFLPIEALQQRIAYIREFYQRQDEKIEALFNRPYIYLSQQEMDKFIDETDKILHQVFSKIWIDKKKLPNFRSVLEWEEIDHFK